MGEPSRKSDYFRIEVQRGDSIFVPADYRVRRDRTAEILDATYKLAISVGAVAAILK